MTYAYAINVPTLAYITVNATTGLSRAGCDLINSLPQDEREAATDAAFAAHDERTVTTYTWRANFINEDLVGRGIFPTHEAAFKAAKIAVRRDLLERRNWVQKRLEVS